MQLRRSADSHHNDHYGAKYTVIISSFKRVISKILLKRAS